MTTLAIIGGRVIDPAGDLDRVADVWVRDGRIAAIGEQPDGFPEHERVAADGLVVCPGLVDLCARLREPGAGHKGTIASESRAALAGGVTTLCCPPDTTPVIDTPATVELIRRRADDAGHARVCPVGALTVGLEGMLLAPLAGLAEEGCVAVGQAGQPVTDTHVLRSALEYATALGLTVMLTPRDPWLSTGCAHAGAVATDLGLAGVPVAAETAELERILTLAGDCGARIHVGRLSAADSVELIARARARGVAVTADVAAHQLHLTEAALAGFNSQAHVQPPLRSDADRLALRAGVADGTIDCVVSDHQPHDADAKLAPFAATEPGISALETLLPLVLDLARCDECPLPAALARLTAGPAAALGLTAGSLAVGRAADICLFDPQAEWTLEPAAMISRGRNTPFGGYALRGRVVEVLRDGRRRTSVRSAGYSSVGRLSS